MTDRTRASVRDRVKDVEVRIVEKTDTVYVAVRDSVSSFKFQVSGDSLNPKPSTLILTLKWIFAVICAVGVLIIVINLKGSG